MCVCVVGWWVGGFAARRVAALQCARARGVNPVRALAQAHLKGGRLVSLLPAGHPGMPEVKWGANRFSPFLCINPEADDHPAPRDEEEFIHVSRPSRGTKHAQSLTPGLRFGRSRRPLTWARRHGQVVRMSIGDLRRLLIGGELLTPSTVTCFLAFEYLAKECSKQPS